MSTKAKSKQQKKNPSAFCTRRKKRKWSNNTSIPFPAKARENLAKSDQGSWFAQEDQWPQDFENATKLEYVSASKRKLKDSKNAFLRDSDNELDEGSSGGNDGDADFVEPLGNYIVDSNNIQELLATFACCKVCHSSLEIFEEVATKQGLGAKWIFRCSNEDCASLYSYKSLHISPKDFAVSLVSSLLRFNLAALIRVHP